MKQKILALGLVLLSTGSWFVVYAFVHARDPYQLSWGEFVIFYVAIFTASFPVFAVMASALAFFFRKRLQQRRFSDGIRQGMLAAGLLSFSLFLQGHDLLFWWVELTLVLLVCFIEFFLAA